MSEQTFHRPGHLAGGVIAVAVQMLPAEHRDRYSDELRADLCLVGKGRQMSYALGMLAGAPSLRHAVKAQDDESAARSVTYWKCRLGRHRYVVVNDDNPEFRASTHKECSRCLKFKEIKEYEHTDGAYLTGGGMG